jgi:uncharacterized OB-fold protein
MIEGLPLPATGDPIDAAFWDAACEDRLVLQACGDCGEPRFPPRPMCPHCQSESIAWIDDDGRGTVWSYAIPSPPLLPAFEAMLPYVTVIGALVSHPHIRIAGMAVREDGEGPTGLGADDIAVGQSLQLIFRPVSDECALPFWRLGAAPATEMPS